MTRRNADPNYYRASLGLMNEVAGALAADYHSALIDGMREAGGRLDLAEGGLRFRLAKEFGFCYGVDKAVDMAYEARAKFPDRRIVLLTEIIHNPRVNKRMADMGIEFLTGQFAGNLAEEDLHEGDVILIPAFGTSAEQMQRLRDKRCILVDTTCGSVVRVWKRVEQYARDGFTSIVHGKYAHEETIATVSMARAKGGQTLVVRDEEEANRVCDFIDGKIDAEDLLRALPEGAISPGFDPAEHLQFAGVANQTTMLASESLEIARRIGAAMARRYGDENRDTHFRSFDTICSATQERQDAMYEMIENDPPGLVLVIGGYNSSNTGHLLEVAETRCRAFHIQDAGEMLSADRIRHLPFGAKEPIESNGWLSSGPLTIGLTAGASTPNKALADAIARVLDLRGIPVEKALAVLEQSSPPNPAG